MDSRDAERTAQEENLNNFESLIYAIKNALEDDDVIAVSTEADRSALLEKVLAAQEWLEDSGYTAKTPEIVVQHQILDVSWSPIALRRKESVERPIAVAALIKEIEKTRMLVDETVANQTKSEKSDVKVYLETPPGQLDTINGYLKEADDWVKEKVKAQESKEAHEESAFSSEECGVKRKGLRTAYKTFEKAKKWKYVPVESTTVVPASETTIEPESEGEDPKEEESESVENDDDGEGAEKKEDGEKEKEDSKVDEGGEKVESEGDRDEEDL
jgi:hypoxia up-regulated 1